MMQRETTIAGVGGIAFGILSLLALLLGRPPGGTYSASDVQQFVASDHRAAVVVAIYLALLGVLGLIALLGYLRESLAGVAPRLATTFWGVGLAGAACLLAGWAINLGPATAPAPGIGPAVTYLVVQVGGVLVLAGAGVMLGLALIILFLGSDSVLPVWLRWATLIAGIVALASPVFFPFLILLLWGIVAGVGLLMLGRRARI